MLYVLEKAQEGIGKWYYAVYSIEGETLRSMCVKFNNKKPRDFKEYVVKQLSLKGLEEFASDLTNLGAEIEMGYDDLKLEDFKNYLGRDLFKDLDRLGVSQRYADSIRDYKAKLPAVDNFGQALECYETLVNSIDLLTFAK